MNDITNKKFGRWTVIKFAYIKNRHTYWLCKCNCGKKKNVSSYTLTNGESKSCGCLAIKLFKKRRITHNLSYTKFYKHWVGIKERCFYKKNISYKYYGGRGITVCERWKTFLNFRDDMFESYKEHKLNNKSTSLDRINNDGNYELNNCRWATRKEQQNNTRYNCLLTYKGQTLNITQWAEKLNLNRNVLYGRTHRNWSIEKLLSL